MRTDYTKEQMMEMMPKVPLGTRCYFSDFYSDGTSTCIISYVEYKDTERIMTLVEVVYGDSVLFFPNKEARNSYAYIFPVEGFEALGIYPSNETPEYKFGDVVYTKPGTRVRYIATTPDGRFLVVNPENWGIFLNPNLHYPKSKAHYSVHQIFKSKPKRKLTMMQLEAIVGEPFEIKEGA